VTTVGGTTPSDTVVSFSGTDTDSAVRDLAGMYSGRAWYSAHTDHDYWYRYVGIGDDQMSIRRSQMHGHLRGEAAVEGEVVVHWIDAGSGRLDVGRDETSLQPGVPTLTVTGQRFEFEYEDWDERLVHLDRKLVLDVASEQYLVDGTFTFDRSSAPSAAATQHWRGSVAEAIAVLRSEGTRSLSWNEAQRRVVRSLFALYPFRADRLPDGYGEHRKARLRTAIDFLHEHAHQALTVSEIASASGLSVRALQESFQRNLDSTPMNYLREVRLRHTRDELLTATPETTTVAAVASRWGFNHMGRFSNEYLRRYNEYPRQTLRR
jgi:AraC-like DNA-binding protein